MSNFEQSRRVIEKVCRPFRTVESIKTKQKKYQKVLSILSKQGSK